MEMSFLAASCGKLAALSCSNLAALSCSNLGAHCLRLPCDFFNFRMQISFLAASYGNLAALCRQHSGLVVEPRTPEQEVGDLICTQGAMLCP